MSILVYLGKKSIEYVNIFDLINIRFPVRCEAT